MNDAAVDRCRIATIIFSATALTAMIAAARLAGLGVDFASFVPLYLLSAILAIAIPYTVWRNMHRLRCALEVGALGLLMTLPVLVFSYASMRAAFPLADASLMAADAAIGFDWPAFVRWVDRHPRFAVALAWGYSSFSVQILLLPMLLALLGFRGRAYQAVLGYLLLCCIAISISAFFPSLGAYKGYGFDGGALTNVNAHFGYFFLESFAAVRDDPDFTLSVDNAAGIITFPSIHAGVALLCGWAAWPSRLLRIPFIVLNLLMAISAITHGGHYLVDIIAGLAVGTVAIASTRRLIRAGFVQAFAPSVVGAG
jgi:membrane-associated phospholipid phosphatase